MHSRPQIDVVIPAFNAEKYIEKTLASVALQGDLIHSVIVVNDGSTDQTAHIVETFAKSHPKLGIQLINQDLLPPLYDHLVELKGRRENVAEASRD